MYTKLCRQRKENTQSMLKVYSVLVFLYLSMVLTILLLRTLLGPHFYYYLRTSLAGPNPFLPPPEWGTVFPPYKIFYLSNTCTSKKAYLKNGQL